MVIVFSNSAGQYDFIVQTSIAFALAKVGGPVVAYDAMLDLCGHTKLALVGHGNIGTIEKTTAATIGDTLKAQVKTHSLKVERLVVTSCFAGARSGGLAGTSTVEILATKLRGCGLGGLEIVGYTGPSIKNAQLGMFAKVVDPGKVGKVNQPGTAFNIQETLKKDKKYVSLNSRNTSTLVGMEALAKQTADLSQDFYTDFINKLDQAGHLLSEVGDNGAVNPDAVARLAVVID